MNDSQTITLSDGRQLGFAEYGDAAGAPIFYFHGFPGARLEARLMNDVAAARKARVIAVDRPGIGLSDFQPNRRIVDWPRDVSELADQLGIDKFIVVGASGGGPYAAVCARALADRVTSAAFLAGAAPIRAPNAMDGMSTQNRLLFSIARWVPPLGDLITWGLARTTGDRDTLMSQITRSSSPEDRRLLDERPDVLEALYDAFVEAFKQGSRGARWELRLYGRPWGFRLDKITVPVALWQGEKDANVPPSMGRYLADTIPDCRATFLPDDGHSGCIFNHLDDVLDAVLTG
jgi:pimeloyl-ACP methyl ester carboxylesterase